MPAWRQGQAVGEWRQIANSALVDSATRGDRRAATRARSPRSIAWTSFAIDTRNSSIYSVANGGHHDYAGNEVNRIGLLDGAPKWTEPRASTPMSQTSEDVSHYADGRPASRHTYYGAIMNEIRNRAMVLGGAIGATARDAATDGFNLSNNDWDAASSYPNAPSEYTSAFGNAVTQHRATGDIYVFGNFAVARWSNASNTWSRLLCGVGTYGQSCRLGHGHQAQPHLWWLAATTTIAACTTWRPTP